MDLTRPEIGGLLRELADLKERVKRLERGNPLAGQLPAGESIEVVDPADGSALVTLGNLGVVGTGAAFRDTAGTLVAAIGQLAAGPGIMVGNNPTPTSADTFFLTTNEGIIYPWLGFPWYQANYSVPITNASFENAWQTIIPLTTGSQMYVEVVVGTGVGTTGEFRVRHINSGATTSVVSVGAAATVTQVFRWDLGTDMFAGSGPARFEIQARRTGGAGNVNVYGPGAIVVSAELGGTATGI